MAEPCKHVGTCWPCGWLSRDANEVHEAGKTKTWHQIDKIVCQLRTLPSVIDISKEKHDSSGRDDATKQDLLERSDASRCRQEVGEAQNGPGKSQQGGEIVKKEREERHKVAGMKRHAGLEGLDVLFFWKQRMR